MGHILLVDGSPIVYSVYNVIGHLSHNGEPTGLRYGFLKNVRSYAKKQEVDRVVICWDTPGTSIKAQHFPEYKNNRNTSKIKGVKEQMYSQIPALKHLIGLTRWSQAEAVGFEADDVIAGLCRKLSLDGHKITIISPYEDLFQLIFNDVTVWWPPNKQSPKGYDDIYKKYGFNPVCIAIWKSFVDDVSDNIKGVGLSVNEKEQLSKILNWYGNKFDNDSLVDFFTNIMLESKYVLIQELHSKLLDYDVKNKVEQNFKAIKLISPDNLSITKGTANKVELQEKLREIACFSLLKTVDEFLTGYGGIGQEMSIQADELQRFQLGFDPGKDLLLSTLKDKILSGELNVQLDSKGNVFYPHKRGIINMWMDDKLIDTKSNEFRSNRLTELPEFYKRGI